MFTYSLSGLEIKGSADTLQEVEENETTARSAVYQLFAQLFRPPSPDSLKPGPLGDPAVSLEPGPLGDPAVSLEPGPLGDPAVSLEPGPLGDPAGHAGKFRDGFWTKELSKAAELLPFDFEIDDAASVSPIGDAEYLAEWQRLFGDDTADGATLRSGAHGDTDNAVSEVHREYEYFGLATDSAGEIPADHLSIECDFMGFVCFKEAAVSSERLRASYRRAQSDFLGRFLAPWFPAMAADMQLKSPLVPFDWALRRLDAFLQSDHAYLASLLGT